MKYSDEIFDSPGFLSRENVSRFLIGVAPIFEVLQYEL